LLIIQETVCPGYLFTSSVSKGDLGASQGSYGRQRFYENTLLPKPLTVILKNSSNGYTHTHQDPHRALAGFRVANITSATVVKPHPKFILSI